MDRRPTESLDRLNDGEDSIMTKSANDLVPEIGREMSYDGGVVL